MSKAQLISTELLRSLLENATQILNKPKKKWAKTAREDRVLWLEAALEAVRFCSILAPGDPSLLVPLVEALHAAEGYVDPYDNPGNLSVVTAGISKLLSNATELPEEIIELCQYRDQEVRAQIAAGLRPRGPKEIALLESLAADPVTKVRKAAKKSLASRGEVPWWFGKFTFDPLSRLSEEEAASLKPVLEAISLACNGSYHEEENASALIALVEKLPPILAVDIAELCLSRYELVRYGYLGPLGALLFARGGGIEAALRLLQRWVQAEYGTIFGGGDLAKMLAPLPEPERLSLCLQGLRILQQRPNLPRGLYQKDPLELLAAAIVAAWPSGADAAPVLEVVLSLPERAVDEPRSSISHDLMKLFQREGINTSSIQERVIEAFLSGCPGPWRLIQWDIRGLLRKLPIGVLRTVAESAISNEDQGIVCWGLQQLMGPAHQPAHDLPRPELIKTFVEHPRFRGVVFGDSLLGEMALPLLRIELREGRTEFLETARVMQRIDPLYGGLVNVFTDHYLQRIEAQHQEKQEKLKDFLGPEALRGVPTEDEWCRYRALRDEATQSFECHKAWEVALTVYPVGERQQADKAFLMRALERSRAGFDDDDLSIAMSLAAIPSQEDVPLFDELIKRNPGEDLFLEQKKRALRKLGVTIEQEAPDEWMDSDD